MGQIITTRTRTSTLAVVGLVAFAVGFILGALTWSRFNPVPPVIQIERDTLTVIDTMRVDVPTPTENGEVRRDTFKVLIQGQKDTIYVDSTKNKESGLEPIRLTPEGNVSIPITQREYATEHYRAVVEGFRPTLKSMEVYPRTTTVTNTVTRSVPERWVLVAGGGAGYDGQRIRPHIGITLGWRIAGK